MLLRLKFALDVCLYLYEGEDRAGTSDVKLHGKKIALVPTQMGA